MVEINGNQLLTTRSVFSRPFVIAAEHFNRTSSFNQPQNPHRPCSELEFLRSRLHVLIATTREVHENRLVFAFLGELNRASDGVTGLECRNKSLGLAQFAEGCERLFICNPSVLTAADGVEHGVFGPTPG